MKYLLCTGILFLSGLIAYSQSETRTAGALAKELKALGFEVKEGIGGTGVTGILQNGNGPVVMYRAYMDCKGVETPVMHGCGHDAHVTSLIGVAKLMVQMKNQWKGTLIVVGQPAEEQIPDAETMVNDGHFSKHSVPQPHVQFGTNTTTYPVGFIGPAKGTQMAGTEQVDIVFKGDGSTSQSPKDPIVMAASAIIQYQTITASDNNVIPLQSLVKLNLRWFDEKGHRTMTMKGWAYPLVNSDGLTDVVVRGIKKLVPLNNYLQEDQVPRAMGSDDCRHLVIHNTKKDYCYIVVGMADKQVFTDALKAGKQVPDANYNGDNTVELAAIPLGVNIGMASLLEIFNWATASQ